MTEIVEGPSRSHLCHQCLFDDQKKSPAKNIDQGIERIEDAACKEIDSRNYPAPSAMLRASLPQEMPAFSFDSEPWGLVPFESSA